MNLIVCAVTTILVKGEMCWICHTADANDRLEIRSPLISLRCYFGRLWLSISYAMCEECCQYRKFKRQFFAGRDRHWFQIANNLEVMLYYSRWGWHFKEIINNKQRLLGSLCDVRVLGVDISCFQTPDAWMFSRVFAWWRHQMEAFSALLALVRGISPVTGEFPEQEPVTRSKRL